MDNPTPIYTNMNNNDEWEHDTPDAGNFLRSKFNIPPHVEVNLYALPDPPENQRPSYTLPCLVLLAIYGSPRKMLTLQEIYASIESRFEWYRLNAKDKSWKVSIRHNLSLNKLFQKRPRPETEPGMGHYWRIDVSKGEGNKRERKRGNRSGRRSTNTKEDHSDDENDIVSSSNSHYDNIDPILLGGGQQ